MGLQQRIRILRNINYTRANCIGTALYLAGLIEWETFINPGEAESLVGGLDKAKSPGIGDIAIFGKFDHVAVVTQIRPVRFAHRGYWKGPFEENLPRESLGLRDRIRARYLKIPSPNI